MKKSETHEEKVMGVSGGAKEEKGEKACKNTWIVWGLFLAKKRGKTQNTDQRVKRQEEQCGKGNEPLIKKGEEKRGSQHTMAADGYGVD